MAKVLGLGGVFFKCEDPQSVSAWYEKWLGLPLEDNGSVSFKPEWMPAGAFSVWGPFKATTTYFEPTPKEFMMNLIIDDLEGALSQVAEGGAEIVGEIEEYDYGRFGWFIDPAGTKVELWQPPG